MNLYLLIFNRKSGSVELQAFSDPHEAIERLREAERRRSDEPELEIVLLNASDIGDLRRTHARYFESITELLEPA
jgi:hypothetical protein